MESTRRADRAVADRLRLAAAREPLPGTPRGTTAAELAASISAGSAHQARFRTEIDAAVTGTALALDAARPHPDPDRIWEHAAAAHPDPTVWFEQAVLLGHPTHPLARSRGTLDPDQTRAYAPEHRPRFDLGLYQAGPLRTSPDWPTGPLLPVHPWQAHRHRLDPPARTWPDTAPLMSLRTVSTGRHHIKCAVDLQLTSAIRHVSAAAAHNGPALAPLLTGPADRCGITVLNEQAAIATGGDRPRPELAAIIRPAPATLTGDRTVPVAALAEPCPATGRPIAAAIADRPLDQWWPALVDHLLAPLRLYAATGIALEAHGQNLLVAFHGDRPTRLIYRDLGSLRLPRRNRPALHGDLQTDDEDERIRKLLAALFPTTLTALVDALATWTGTDPARWWRTVARAAAEAAAGSAPLHRAALKTDWPVKATTAMRLADRPTTDLWTRVDNPLADT
ncbi:IucA/IucC family protein [Glycomyces xiaoerkulensis]|uniref:IucA/IucC family protein n=1 Tax=Glycomyces xiaoerkulensis TaxID=2038139 RepID=UPI000C26A1A3|nr:IucA/IucC family protein [Glycomyces xiaoerkulensis]